MYNFESSVKKSFILFPLENKVEFDLEAVSLDQIGTLGIPVDHYDPSTGRFISLVVSGYGVQKLTDHGIPHKILSDDYSQYIENRNIKYNKAKAAGKISAAPDIQRRAEEALGASCAASGGDGSSRRR